jgi:hypothetical protein
MAAGPGNRFSFRGNVPPNGPAQEPPQREPAADDVNDGTGPRAAGRLREQFEELVEFVRLYLAVRIDAIGSSLRRAVVGLALAACGLLVIAALLVTSVVVFVLGIAEIIGRALGDRFWAGNLITGFGLLLISGLIAFATLSALARSSRERTIRKYEQRHQQQRARFGHDAREQAEARPDPRK